MFKNRLELTDSEQAWPMGNPDFKADSEDEAGIGDSVFGEINKDLEKKNDDGTEEKKENGMENEEAMVKIEVAMEENKMEKDASEKKEAAMKKED